jgi:hypothetical protein
MPTDGWRPPSERDGADAGVFCRVDAESEKEIAEKEPARRPRADLGV